MTFKINSGSYNLQDLVRRCGYRPLGYTEKGELNCVRPLRGQDYPRFHIYLKEEAGSVIFNLHLDQKKPSYEGSTAHSGDYDSDLIKEEAERIKDAVLR